MVRKLSQKRIGNISQGNPLVFLCLGLCAFTAEGPGSVPGWGSKILEATRHGKRRRRRRRRNISQYNLLKDFQIQCSSGINKHPTIQHQKGRKGALALFTSASLGLCAGYRL